MPYLKITSCKDCPHHRIEREDWMDDCFRIFCGHEDQTNTEGHVTKINRGGTIYFNCPLEKSKHDYECKICGWKGDNPLIGWRDDNYCPDCSSDL